MLIVLWKNIRIRNLTVSYPTIQKDNDKAGSEIRDTEV